MGIRRAFGLLVALLLVVVAALAATLFVSTQGYRALTREEVAAIVRTEPAGAQRFVASLELPDGRAESFRLAGDQVYIDARILKWKPIANLIGLHTAYELDRITGRYSELEDERTKARTVFPLGREKPLDLFDLRRSLPVLKPLVDAEYGSATFITASAPAAYELRVSTSGLLIRRIESQN
jgi:hypothetical protein